jgi:hypothetical protein
VLAGAVVDFVFVAMIDVVEQIEMLLFISNVGMFFLDFFFFSHSSTPPDFVPCSVTQRKKEVPTRNSLTTKERQNSEKKKNKAV